MKFEKLKNKLLNEKVLFGVHESGLRIYVIPKKGFSKYYAIYGTEYGSLNREFVVPGENKKTVLPDGVAHFLEHKLFEEENGENAFDRFSKTGANSNAFTSFDMTAYLFSCTSSFYENLDILVDFVNHPYFTDENVAKEQGIIGQEIKMYDDEPGWRVFFNMLGAMYHNNPVKVDIAGTVESIAKITPEILYKCTKTFYNPSNMVLTVVGDIDENKVAQCVDKYVSSDKDLGRIKTEPVYEPKERVKEFVEQKLSVANPLFQIGFKETETGITGEKLIKKATVTDIILQTLFGKSSDFYMSLYEKGLIDSSFDADEEFVREYGFSSLTGESPEPKKVYSAVCEHIDKMKKQGLDKTAVRRVKKILIGKEIKMYNNVEGIGIDFIKSFMLDYNPLDYIKLVESITMEDITRRLNEHFDTSNAVLSVINPQ